jgi:hypothetical protein
MGILNLAAFWRRFLVRTGWRTLLRGSALDGCRIGSAKGGDQRAVSGQGYGWSDPIAAGVLAGAACRNPDAGRLRLPPRFPSRLVHVEHGQHA